MVLKSIGHPCKDDDPESAYYDDRHLLTGKPLEDIQNEAYGFLVVTRELPPKKMETLRPARTIALWLEVRDGIHRYWGGERAG